MHAWQSRRRIAAAVGLLAMLLQLCVSFGHVHVSNLARADLARTMSLHPSGCAARSDCSRHIPPGLPDDDCPICAAIHMAATGVPPTPPAIAIPAGFVAHIQRPFTVTLHLAARRPSPFQTRAPPLA
jgi:hypothetical protein